MAYDRELYGEAARLSRVAADMEVIDGDRVHAVEDLALLAESLAVLGDVDGMVAAGQRLVDLAQEIGSPKVATRALVRVGGRWLEHGEVDLSADCFAAAIVGSIGGEDAGGLSDDLVFLLSHVAYEVNARAGADADAILERILTTTEARYGEAEGLVALLREAMPKARVAVREIVEPLPVPAVQSGDPMQVPTPLASGEAPLGTG